MLRRAAVLKRICDRRRAQNAILMHKPKKDFQNQPLPDCQKSFLSYFILSMYWYNGNKYSHVNCILD